MHKLSPMVTKNADRYRTMTRPVNNMTIPSNYNSMKQSNTPCYLGGSAISDIKKGEALRKRIAQKPDAKGYRLFTETRFTERQFLERQFTERRFTECFSHRQTSSQKTFLTENTFTEDPNTERRLTEYSLHRTKLLPPRHRNCRSLTSDLSLVTDNSIS